MSMTLRTSTALRSLQPVASQTCTSSTKSQLTTVSRRRNSTWFLKAWSESVSALEAGACGALAKRADVRVYATVSDYGQMPESSVPTPEVFLSRREEWQRRYLLEEAKVAPQPSAFQQTVRCSFTRSGVGLHSGAPVTVRVRPAFAGEGRYFVMVPEGTIVELEEEEEEETASMSEEEKEDMKVEYFKMSLLDEEERAQREQELFPEMVARTWDPIKPQEQPLAKPPKGEVRIPANLTSVPEDSAPLALCTRLRSSDGTVEISTVEHLLSALEALGVDNARIEVEEGSELPILDGSPEGWSVGVCQAGVVPALTEGGEQKPRLAFKPTEPIVVRSGDAFVMLNPEEVTRLSYSVDFTAKSTAIGKQHFSWCPAEDDVYPLELSKARTFTTMEDVEAARTAGLIKGGSPTNALIANGADYYNPPLRFENEAVRHKMADLIGDLALLNTGGNGGLPIGHVVAYKAGHDLHVKFARALLAACKEENRVSSVVKS
mmetsp:Transcript_28654/g.39574  ORF Transcript_28654/g.39574 Transcript_28654/m.39574 type:complete len:491 (+) Transcript_28654:92-1564(+)|eukprot:CAMPEP_0196589146 /NCGR_PEP_ID=MMETSP1081-20130531/62833_1 /TAXON_ID=36882 /ORGANISM="Pyramimonas amylifera, Strain CCMP720" /LENGTH=490 /DNA_ID=CAMNT_0041911869 /DNA_START=90 /DNA_END=1562 /DNA_ORIENTATION=+